jgi:hypothetical protein
LHLFHHALHVLYHALHVFHHALHLSHHLGGRWCACTSLGRLLLGRLGATGMMLLVLLGLDSSDQHDSQNKGQASRLARDALHTCLLSCCDAHTTAMCGDAP